MEHGLLDSQLVSALGLKRQTVVQVAEARLPTESGEFRIVGYRSLTSREEFVALIMGEMRHDRASLVRIHSQCLTGDVFGSVRCDCGRQLHAAMKLIAGEGSGVIVYQQQEGRGIGHHQQDSRLRIAGRGRGHRRSQRASGFRGGRAKL